MRFIFIGDVHGCIDEFEELVRLVDVRSGDRVICLGDFMDKGPDRAIDEQPSDERTLATESAWSLLRETFECRDFDDSLVFAE